MIAAAAVAWACMLVAGASACPFCGVVGRSLAERRDAADAVAVAAADGPARRDPDGLVVQQFTIVAALRGPPQPAREAVEASVVEPVAGTAVLFGTRDGVRTRWEAVAADEAVIDHVSRAPALDHPAAERLRWFAARLDHPNPAIAADAFAEFGRAPFEAVREVADAFDPADLAARLGDPHGDQRRRGFHGLALGLAARAAGGGVKAAAVAALEAAVVAPAADLRAGYDGILAGLLVADGEAGLAFLRRQGLVAGTTRAGDARHVLAALRFAWQSLADSVPRPAIAAATADLLDNPAVAAEAAVDLARYGQWDAVDRIAALWTSLGPDDPLVRRAVAGYLTACPRPEAARQRERIAADDPVAWQAAVAAAASPAR